MEVVCSFETIPIYRSKGVTTEKTNMAVFIAVRVSVAVLARVEHSTEIDLKKWVVRVWIGFIWVRIVSSLGFC
jgi:hypothetical protein